MEVLNKGHIHITDYLPNNGNVIQFIANKARISYGNSDEMSYDDAKILVNKMLKNGHSSPFEHVILEFEVKCPLFVARQWIRHRTGSYNEISARYSEVKPDFYVASEERYLQFNDVTLTYDEFKSSTIMCNDICYNKYLDFCRNGVPKEVARTVLPVGMYTTFYFKMDLHNLFHFLKLRQSYHAQYEIREYANAIVKLIKELGTDWNDLMNMFID